MNLSWQQKVIGFIICAIIAAIFIVVVSERGKRRTERERERLEGKSERERKGEGMEREGEGMKREGEREREGEKES